MQFEYIVMHSTVILFILGATFTTQVKACVVKEAYPSSLRKKDEVGDEMRDLSNFISRFQSNFIQNLIDIKFNATFGDMESVTINSEKLTKEEFGKAINEGYFVDHCMRLLALNATFLARSISMEYNGCVLNLFEFLTPVENDIRDFIKKLARCPLNIDPMTALLCSHRTSRDLTFCIEVNATSNSENLMPSVCNLEQCKPKKERLQDNALRLASEGQTNAIDCISEYQKKFKADRETLVEAVKECMAKNEFACCFWNGGI